MSLGIPKELIHIEQFGGAIETSNTTINTVDNAELAVKINGQNHSLRVPKGETILQALKKANTNPPYSCESGVCATCVATITKGKAEMKACMALEDKEIESGLILTCQALPVTEQLEIKFD